MSFQSTEISDLVGAAEDSTSLVMDKMEYSLDDSINPPSASTEATQLDTLKLQRHTEAVDACEKEKYNYYTFGYSKGITDGSLPADSKQEKMLQLLQSHITSLSESIAGQDAQRAALKLETQLLENVGTTGEHAQNAPDNYSNALAVYEIYMNGVEAWLQKLETKVDDQTNQLAEAGLDRFSNIVSDTYDSIQNYITSSIFLERLMELYGIRKMEYEQIKNALDNQQFTTWTNNRKVGYEHKATSYVDNIRFYIDICYYILFIVYLFVGDFFVKKRYKDYKAWILIVIYLLIPVCLNWIVIKLFAIGKKIQWYLSNKGEKDVYVNL